jgi:hypothetical protein
MKPNKFYIKYILNADRKAKVLDDYKVYGDMKSVNQTLQEVKQDHFIEQQILTRQKQLQQEKDKYKKN